jgi:DNA-binding PadR family transcriptional regulator
MKVLQSKSHRQLSDLEGATLAALAQFGQATSYQLANEFASSPSEFWSGSAGAIYPLMARLEKSGFVSGQAGTTGARARVIWSVTDAGREAMMAWLLDDTRAAGMGFDPLRTRLVHLNLVPEALRRPFLEAVREKTQAKLDQPAFKDSERLQTIHESWLSARLAWLTELMSGINRKT